MHSRRAINALATRIYSLALAVNAWWFNPRDGSAKEIGSFENKGVRWFTPPDYGETIDWVLVLHDASKNYPPPGQTPL